MDTPGETKAKIVQKPWGQEAWIAHNEFYALKLITLRKGFKTSLQYHREKRETNYIDQGRVRCWIEDDKGRMQTMELEAGAILDVVPGRKHRIEALEDTRLIEASTPQLDDVVRVQDDFGRGDGRIASEHGEDD